MLNHLESRGPALEVKAEGCRGWERLRQSAAMAAIDWEQVPVLVLRQMRVLKEPVQLRGRRQVLLLIQVQEQKLDQKRWVLVAPKEIEPERKVPTTI